MDQKVPWAWRWSLWQKAREPHSQWVKLIEYSQDFVFKTKELLERLEYATYEFVVCRPGVSPPQ